MPRILVIEDDPKIVKAIEKTVSLERAFTVDSVSDPARALAEAVRLKPDVILLDVKLPGGDGRLIIKALKEHASTARIPVIFLTGMDSEGDKVVGLNLGADDYVVKPFGALELLARIQAVLRRSRPAGKGAATGSVKAGPLTLEPESRTAFLKGKALKLQPREFEILLLLASHAGRTLSRSYLIENSSSYGMPVSTRSLDTHIKNLRKKLGAHAALIETFPKFGYRFSSDA